MDLTIGVTASKRRPATFSPSFFAWTPNLFFCFPPLFMVHSKTALECNYGPLRLLFDYPSVNFWWSLARMRLLISQLKRKLPCVVPSIMVLYSPFPADPQPDTLSVALGDAIFYSHI